MKHMLAGIGLLLFSTVNAASQPLTCSRTTCPHEVQMASLAADKVYGLLLGAPEAGCRRVRYRVETSGQVLLGRTPVLAAGEVAVVRVGNGFQAGSHTLIITAEGCGKAPVLSRRVTLRKASPDHGWRAALVLAALVLPDATTPSPGTSQGTGAPKAWVRPSFPWSPSTAKRDNP